jgi:hypothetical protein
MQARTLHDYTPMSEPSLAQTKLEQSGDPGIAEQA